MRNQPIILDEYKENNFILFKEGQKTCSINSFFGVDLAFDCDGFIEYTESDIFRDVDIGVFKCGFFAYRTEYGKVFGVKQGDCYFLAQILSSHTSGTNLRINVVIGKNGEFIQLYTLKQIKSVYKQIKFDSNVRKTMNWIIRLNKNFDKMSEDDIEFCKSLVGEEKFNMAKFAYVDNAIGYIRQKNLFKFTATKNACKYDVLCHDKLKQLLVNYAEDFSQCSDFVVSRILFMIPLKNFGYVIAYFTPDDYSFDKNIYVKLDLQKLDTSIYKSNEKEVFDVHKDFVNRVMIQSKLSNVDVYDILLSLDENSSKIS